jgi:hypothetical protein
MQTYTSTTFGYPEPSKKDIIERLFMAGHITFNEMWTLLQDTPDIKYYPLPQPPYVPDVPQWQGPYSDTPLTPNFPQ